MVALKEMTTWRSVRVSLVRETGEPFLQPATIRSGRDVAGLVRSFLADDPRENFVAVYLDARHRPIAVHRVSTGTASSSLVHPREVFGPAMHLSASAIVVAHNHPSGDPNPSPEDRMMTDRLRKSGEILGIDILDHVVIGAQTYYSFAAEVEEPFQTPVLRAA